MRFSRAKSKAKLAPMPWTTFTEPEIVRVGQAERDARRALGGVAVVRVPFTSVDRAHTEGDTEGFVKLVVSRRGQLLGGRLVGAHVGEYIQEVTLAMRKGRYERDRSGRHDPRLSDAVHGRAASRPQLLMHGDGSVTHLHSQSVELTASIRSATVRCNPQDLVGRTLSVVSAPKCYTAGQVRLAM